VARCFFRVGAEIEAEDFCPESRGLRITLIAGAKRHPLPDHDEPRQPHRELGKEIVIGYGESELDPMPERGIAEIRIHPWQIVYLSRNVNLFLPF
jgi:hypothetical protein